MAGGKETPRQKMISMMYLVLTALLALNVSKSILDAFVAIEENTQKSNIAQYDRGESFKKDVVEEINTTPNNAENKLKLAKLAAIKAQMDKVDDLTGKMIKQIDDIKLEILEKSGEDIKPVKENDENTILWKKYDAKNPCVPTRMHLMAVQAKDQYDVPMHEIIGEDIKRPSASHSGMKLWNNLNKFRSDLVETVGSYSMGENSFKVKTKAINEYKTNNDLTTKVQKMIEGSGANLKEDAQVLQDIYINLTKPERLKVHDQDGVHWIGATFDHSPLVAAVASLSSMQQDILSARAMALAHLKSKVTTGEYSFNKIVGLAYGPAIANSGDEVEIKVMMAAFDSDNQPKVTGPGAITVENGQGTLKLKVSGSSEMNLSGTVAIKNKSGVEKKENWTHKIKIMKPEGTVTLPEMNVLYRGYNNVVTGVASGYDQTMLTGTSNVTLTKSGTGWIGKPGPAATAIITVSGKNSVTNKTVALGKFEFRVKGLPKPSIFVGAVASGGKISTNPGGLNAGYPPEIPLKASFSVLDWEASVTGIMGKKKGQGSSLAGIGSLLGQAKPGSVVVIEAGVRGPDGKVNRIYETFKL